MRSGLSRLLVFAISAAIPLLFSYWIDHVDKLDVPSQAFSIIRGSEDKENDEFRVFNIDIEEERLSDLKERLSLRRLPNPSCQFFQNLAQVLTDFDWSQHQHFLNTFKQYTTKIEEMEVHFIRASIPPPKNSQVIPLLLLHGFPGSYWDFFKMIPFLSNPSRFAFDFGVKRPILFDVIVPSLPGFIFSDKPTTEDFSHLDIARILMKLMKNLNVERYFIHGNEKLGTDVATLMATVDTNVWGLHISNPLVDPFFNYKVALKSLYSSDTVSIYEYLTQSSIYTSKYSEFIATAASDSPLALCSFIMENWSQYSSPTQSLNELFTLDELATICHLYWLTDSLPSALKISSNSQNTIGFQVSVPTAIVQSPEAPWRSSPSVLKHQFTNITRFTQFDKGGIFTNLQNGEALAADIFRFVETTIL